MALSSCAGKKTIEVHTLNMRDGLVNYRDITVDNKTCEMTTKFKKTEVLSMNQNNSVCISRKQFDDLYKEYVKQQCGKE